MPHLQISLQPNMDNQSPNRNMRRKTGEQERRTKAQIRSNNLDAKSKRGKPLKCDRCDRLFLNEQTLKYHTVMCNKTRVLGKGERRTVKDFFPSDDDDDSINLLFFTEKNLELTSKQEIIASVEEKLGVSVTEFTGKEKASDSEPQKKRRRRKRATPIKTKKKAEFLPKKESNQVQCDCCIQGRKEWEPISKGKKSETCKATSSASASPSLSPSPCSSSSSSCSSSSSASSPSSGDEDGCEMRKDILTVDVKKPNLRGTAYFKDNFYILPFHQNIYKSMVSPPTQ